MGPLDRWWTRYPTTGLDVRMGTQALRRNLQPLLRHDVLHVAASLRDAAVRLGETDLSC